MLVSVGCFPGHIPYSMGILSTLGQLRISGSSNPEGLARQASKWLAGKEGHQSHATSHLDVVLFHVWV